MSEPKSDLSPMPNFGTQSGRKKLRVRIWFFLPEWRGCVRLNICDTSGGFLLFFTGRGPGLSSSSYHSTSKPPVAVPCWRDAAGPVNPMADDQFIVPLRQALEQVRDRLDTIIIRLKTHEEPRFMRWRCTVCGHIKHFTRPMPAHVAPPCPKCKGAEFQAMP